MNLPTSITYNDLRVRLQNINCCLAKKADKLNTLLTLGKSCTDDVIKLEFAYKLLDILKTYNTNLVLIPEIDGIQTEVLYESQAEANCITMAQLDSMLQYLQDYCSICFKEYGTYDSGYIVSNDLGGWVGSNPSLIISTQVQADWDQMDSLQPDFIKNKPEIPELLNLIAGDNITITGTYPNLTISSTGGATVNLPENQIAFGDVNDDLTSSSLFIFKNGKLGINVTDPQYTIDIDGGFQNIGDTILDGTVNLPTLVDGSEHLLGISTTGDVKVMSETDPVYTSSSWYTTTNNSTNWNTAYSWGNHANAGYMLKSTYDTDNDGVVDSAQSMMTIGRNSTGSTLYKGTIVYISGSTGNRPNFVKAKADDESTSAGTFGVVYADIANNADGYVVTIGTINTLDTRTTATNPFTSDTLADGDTIYLSPDTAGYVTNIKPTAPNHLVYLGKVVRTSPTQGTIVYRVQNGYELDELHDVQATSPNSNDTLYYDGTFRLWKTGSLTSILGYTPYNASNPSGYITSSALSPYLTSSTAASTYVSLSGSYSNPSWITSLDYSKLTGVPSGTGISSLNGLLTSTQSFATGTTGTDFGISSSSSTHTFNLPIASATNTGKLSNTDWSTFNDKQAALGYTPLNPANNLSDVSSVSIARSNLGLDYTLPVLAETSTDGNISSGTSNTYSTGVLITPNMINVDTSIEVLAGIRKTGTGGNFTIRLYANTTNDLAGSPILIGTFTGTPTTVTQVIQRYLRIKVKNGTGAGTEVQNATNATAQNDYIAIASAVSNLAIDWTSNKYIVAALQMTSGADSAKITFLKVRR